MNALIIDDEILTRQKVKQLSKRNPDLNIIGECNNGRQGLEMIKTKKPDLIFLDIQMPEVDGFKMLSLLKGKLVPQIIFITAYSDFAIKAFEVNAVDYLLKPIKKERFEEAVQRCKERLKDKSNLSNEKKLKNLIEELIGNTQSPRIAVKHNNKINVLKPEGIIWIKAEGNYVKLITGSDSFLKRASLIQMEEILSSQSFIRIHKSHLINLDCLEKIEPHFHGDYIVTMKGGTQLPCSRNYADRLTSALK